METTEALLQTDNDEFIVKNQRLVKLSVLCFLFFDYLFTTMPIPILPDELSCAASKIDRHRLSCVGDKFIFVIFASKSFVQLIVAPFFEKWIDRRGARAPFLISALVLFGSTLLFALGLALNPGYADTATVVCPLLIFARMMQGIGSSGINSAGFALVHVSFSADERGTATGFVMAGTGLGLLTGPILSGLFAMFVDAWVPFGIVVILLGVAISVVSETNIGSTTIGSETLEEEDEGFSNISADPSVLIVARVLTVANMAVALTEPMLPLYLSKAPFLLGSTGQMIVFSTMSFSYVVASCVLVVLSEKHAKWKLLVVGMSEMMFGTAVVVWTQQLWVVIVCTILIGSAMAAVDIISSPLLVEIIHLHGSREYGQAETLHNMCMALGFTIGPLIGAGIMFFTPSVSAMRFETLALALLSLLLVVISFQLRENLQTLKETYGTHL